MATPTQRRRADDDDDRILRDGEILRIPLQMMDAASVSNNAAAQARRALLVDRDSYPQKCVDQPGFAHEPAPKLRDAAASAARMRAYDEYDAAQAIAYQTPNGINGAGSRGPVGPTLGDICTVRGGAGRFGKEGSPGTYQRVDGELVCVAVARSKESTSVTMKPSPSAKPEIYDPARGAIRKQGARYNSDSLADAVKLTPQQALAKYGSAAERSAMYDDYDSEIADLWRGGA